MKRRAAALAASQARQDARSAAARERAQARAKRRADRAAKWETFERRREARIQAERAARKLARARRINFARLAKEKQQDQDRSKRLAEEEATKLRWEAAEQAATVPSGSVRLNVIDGADRGVQITVPKEGVRAHVLMAAAAQRMGLQSEETRFLHGGVELKASDPIEKYKFEDLDTIDVRLGRH